jgi:hypothetical protein
LEEGQVVEGCEIWELCVVVAEEGLYFFAEAILERRIAGEFVDEIS